MISFFRAPIKNITPEAQVSILQIYKYITGGYAKLATDRLRSIADHYEARRYKSEMLDYVTFSGCFSSRRTGRLIEHSGFLCFDIDKIESIRIDITPRYPEIILEEDENSYVKTSKWGVTMRHFKHEDSTPEFLPRSKSRF